MKTIILLFISFFTLVSCNSKAPKTQIEEIEGDVTQVIYFHTKKRCATCNAIERLTKEVVDSIDILK